MRKRILISLLLALSMVFPAAAQNAVAPAAQAAVPAAKPSLDGLDEFVNQAMKDWRVPGVGLAVVQDGKVILLKGYGYRDVDKRLPVTPQTLFAIGSITKSFTVTTLGMLADQGKMTWDTPVRRYLTGFRMYDTVATEEMTPRDLVTHRSGLPRHDLTWYSSDFAREDLVNRLRYLEPNKPLRSTFQYNNLMFVTAGYLAGKLNGTSWEDAVRQRVLAPLSMNSTNYSVLDSQKSADFAQPYRKDKNEDAKLIAFHPIDQIAPAGSINSCADDMSRYLLFHMNKGKLEGKQLLSENNSVQMQIPQMVIQSAPPYKELGENSYGMGFFIASYRGHKSVDHGGNIDGFSAELGFLPNEQIGVVVLVNLDGTPLPSIIARNVFDRLLGLEPVPWSQRFLEQQKKGKESEQEAKKKDYTPHKTGTHPSHPLDDYAGDYQNPGYGIISIARDGDALKMKFNLVSESLRHYHYDVFEVPENSLDPFEKSKIMFHMNMDGDVASLSAPFEPHVADIVFTRMPDKQLTDRSFIEAFAGQYEIPGSPAVFTISLRGDHTLMVSVPGQPDRELVPTRGTSFDLAGLSGFSIDFKRDAAGKVVEAALHQLETTIVLKKK